MHDVLTSNHTKAQFLNVGVIYLKAIEGETGGVWTQWHMKKSIFSSINTYIYIYIYIYISNKILEKIQLVPVVYDYHIRKELLPAQIHLQRLRTFFCFYLFLDSTGYCFTNWMLKQSTISPETGIGSLILSKFWLIRNFSLQLSISSYNVRWVVFYL